ncbi:FAD-dependent oxidoreductase [Massilia cavernae]|uniref:Oxidoreductase n=1 Tax=Massilia cavernae TaxID=2320864 RepID=A0A418XEG7_9BURK|nr:FAD-dependent oxidoreductase [Massilia cavernae]RJG10733.1 oxidoreductase [Massilia cavernae]
MNQAESTKALDVLVVGGGIGGMSAALTLRGIGASVDLIDIDPAWGVSGAGITITGPTLRAFKELGVLDEIMEHGYTGEGIRVCDVDGNVLSDLATPMPPEAGVPGSGGFTRPGLHKILAARVRKAGAEIRLGLTVDALRELDDGVEVSFSDGSTARYDLVIGADGVSSRVRQLIFPDAPKAEYTGQNCWRVTLDRPAGIDRRHYFLGGPLKVGFTPVSKTKMYLFVLETSAKVWREKEGLHTPLAALLKDYGGMVGEIRDGLDAQSEIVFRPLEGFFLPAPWFSGRVLLIGDSAHPTTPQLASGAGMAVEDALVLAEELARGVDVPEALSAFMARREERCRITVENSMEIGRLEQRRAPIAEQTAVVQRTLKMLSEPI